ncbi:hypothetical protein ACSBR2_004895 [Camellia fascicularis]
MTHSCDVRYIWSHDRELFLKDSHNPPRFPAIATAAHYGNETDRLALLAFMSNITHDPFGILSSWNESIHFCQWQGVTCGSRHQRAIVLDLEHQNLTGSISPHIGN